MPVEAPTAPPAAFAVEDAPAIVKPAAPITFKLLEDEINVEKVEVVETVDYSKMLVKDLKALANEKGIEGADKMLKADLVDALNNAK